MSEKYCTSTYCGIVVVWLHRLMVIWPSTAVDTTLRFAFQLPVHSGYTYKGEVNIFSEQRKLRE